MSTWVIDGFLWPECPRAHHLSTTYDDFPDVDHQMIYHTRGKRELNVHTGQIRRTKLCKGRSECLDHILIWDIGMLTS